MVDSVTISHEGYLEILITALGVLAAVFSILIAVLGLIGYSSVKQSAREAAEAAAKQQAESVLLSGLRDHIERMVKDAVNSSLITANARLRSDEQAENLSLGQATDRSEVNHQMDNIFIRPKKRVFKDSGFGEDAL